MPSGALALVPAMVPMVAANGWGRLAVYEIEGGASILTLPFVLGSDGGLDKANFSLMGKRHGGRLKASEDTESTTIAGVEWDVDGSTTSNEGLVDYFVLGF